MFGFELWMLPAAVILTVVALVVAGYLAGLGMEIKQRLTNSTGDTDE